MLVVSDVYTLPDLLARAVNRDPDGDAVVFPDQRVTYLQLFQRATNAARSLKALGVDSGDSVGILMSNCQEFVDLLLGSQFIGAKKEKGSSGHQVRVFFRIDAKAIARGDWDFDEKVTENGHGWYGEFVGHSSGADREALATAAMYADEERRVLFAQAKEEFGF